MPSPFEIQFDSWGSTTLNNKVVATRLPQGHAQVVENIDLQDDSLVGQADSTATTAPTANIPTSPNWIHYVAGGWVGETTKNYSLNDADRVYVAKPGQTPTVYQVLGNSLLTYPLGVSQPVGFTVGTAAAGSGYYPAGTYSFALTTVAGALESNPSVFYSVTMSGSEVLSVTVPTIYYPTEVVTKFNIYRKSSSETVYTYIASVDNVAQTNTITYAATVSTNPQLTWNAGGQTESEPYVADHSVPPVLTCLANSLYTIDGSVAARGKGILFGASGNSLRWSIKDFPEYWPTWARYDLSEEVESIISTQGYVAVATSSTWTKVEGIDHESLRFTQLPAAHYVRKGCGRATVSTPYGIVFLAREGFCIFDGVQTKLITQDTLSLAFVQGLTVNQSGYFDGRYYLFHSSGTVVLDFRQGGVQVSTNTKIATAAHACDFTEPYIADQVGTHPMTGLGVTDGMREMALGVFPNASPNKLLLLSGGTFLNSSGYSTGSSLTYRFNTTNNAYETITNSVTIGPSKAVSFSMSATDHVVVYTGSSAAYITSSLLLTSMTSWTMAGTTPAITRGFTGLPGLTPTAGTGSTSTHYAAAFGDNGYQFMAVTGFTPAYTGTWSAAYANPGYTRTEPGLVHVPGAVAGNTRGYLVAFGGFDSSGNGTATMSIFNLDGNWSIAAGITIIADAATQNGVYARGAHSMVYDSHSQKIFIFGGMSKSTQVNDTAYFADFWEFNPATLTNVTSSITSTGDAGFAAFKARWECSSKFVGNIEQAADVQMVSDGAGRVFVPAGVDGVTYDDRALYSLSPLTMRDCAQVPALFTVLTGESTIKSWGTSATKQAWRWQTGEIVGSNPSAYKTFQRYKIDFTGTIVVKIICDGAAAQTVETLVAASRTEVRDWFPSTGANKPEGKRVSFLFEGAAGSVLYSVSLEGTEDNG
jgi:hypothetical protein